MEKMGHRDLKRGGTKQYGSVKSKKGMLKKLSYEFSSSDLEKEVLNSKKKSKFLKKNLKLSDNNGVDHASVPRKLRSAMKKRNLESVSKLSSGSKRLNRCKTGTQSLIKKEIQEMEAEEEVVVSESMMISKDEKEVAETLYGLAGMFTEISSIDHNKSLSNEKETSKVDSILVAKAETLQRAVSAKTKLTDEMEYDKEHNSTRMVDFLDRLKQSSSVNMTNEPAAETNVATTYTDNPSNGLALWPGLSSTVQSGPQVLSSRTSSTKLPPWMDQAVSPSKNASLLSETLRVQPRKLKRCASHIYISRLIKALQNSNSSPVTPNQIEQTSSEMSQRGLLDPVTTNSHSTNMVSSSKRYRTPHLHDIHRTHNPKTVQESMTQPALELYGPQNSQKQSFNFLSLSSSGAAQSHFPYPNSYPHYHNSTAYNIQHSPATSSHQVQQISPYLATRFQTAYNANQQQQQQLQKRLWAAQYRPQTNGTSSNHYNVKPSLSLNMPSSNIQPLQVASSPRYNNNVTHQQHRLMAAMSMSHHHGNNPSRKVMNRQEHHFPLVYEDTRTPLQLLCNEQS